MPNRQPIALVTGASSGFGRRIAERLHQDGFRTFGTSRTARPDAGGVVMLELDVCSDASVAACLREVERRAGSPDVLVNNAGMLEVGPAEEQALDDVKRLFETNFFGVVRMVNAALPGMRARGAGRIINIGSLAGLLAPPGEAFYAASKFALEGYSEALSYEVSPFGIYVSLLEPGFFKTNLSTAAPERAGHIAAYDPFRAAVRASIGRSIEGGGDPAAVADLVAKVARARRPRLRYRAGTDAVWLPRMRRLMPERMYRWGLRRSFGI